MNYLHNNLADKFVFILFLLITLSAGVYLMMQPAIYFGGDLVEYYGTTESLLNHGTINLTPDDQQKLEHFINPVTFKDPQYYIAGTDGKRYPVHFIFYSLIALPIRVLLQSIGNDPYNTFRITNFLLLTGTIAFVFFRFLKNPLQKLVLLIALYASPLVSFIVWPGPDLFYLCLMLLSLFFFANKQFMYASFLMVLASWHSQPLTVMAGILILYNAIHTCQFLTDLNMQRLINARIIRNTSLLFGLLLVPYVYNYVLFGTITPWTIFDNGWTRLNGFGIHNASLQKLFEQMFDLNMGLFWYTPILVVGGVFCAINLSRKNRTMTLVSILFVLTAFFYQTNPAWHYGTAGFGPSRHIMYSIPLLIYCVVISFKPIRLHGIALALFLITQAYVHSFNGFLMPDFITVLNHSPYAEYVLNTYPALYNPTPEIFVDRTNHLDLDHLSSAVYTNNSVCKKAFMLPADISVVQNTCGFIPQEYNAIILNIPTKGVYINY